MLKSHDHFSPSGDNERVAIAHEITSHKNQPQFIIHTIPYSIIDGRVWDSMNDTVKLNLMC